MKTPRFLSVLLFLGFTGGVLAGCQTLEDYPASTTGATTTDSTQDARADYVPPGGPRLIGDRAFEVTANELETVLIPVSDDAAAVKIGPPGVVGVGVATSGIRITSGGRSVPLICLVGTVGAHYVRLDLRGRNGVISRCWVTLTVSAGRQSVSQ